MIYKPYNVSPHCTAIDASEQNTFSFIFSGDTLKYHDFEIYDAETNVLVRKSYVPVAHKYYNDEMMRTMSHPDTFENGKKYKYKMNLYQEKPDIFVMQGKVRSLPEISLSDTQIPITYGITEIENPIYYNVSGENTLFGMCMIEINYNGVKERRMITGYDSNIKYGEDDGYGNFDYRTYITIVAPFSTYPPEGTTYRIYKNYITTPEYYFECAKLPIVAPSIEIKDYGILHCSASYSQQQGIAVKNYQYSLYKSVNERTIIKTTIDDTAEIATTHIPVKLPSDGSYDFLLNHGHYIEILQPDSTTGSVRKETRVIDYFDYSNNTIIVTEPFNFIPSSSCTITVYSTSMELVGQSDLIYNQSLEYNFDNILVDSSYKLSLKVTLQNDMEYETSISGYMKSYDAGDDYVVDAIVNSEKDCIDILHNHDNSFPIIIREDIVTKEETRIFFQSYPERDYLSASNKKYRYRIINLEDVNGEYVYGKEFVTDAVEPVFNCWTIYGLIDKSNVYKLYKNCYRIDSYWQLFIDGEEGDMIQNINHYTHVNYGTTPKIIMNKNNYISGSLTCDITQLKCPDEVFEDTIYMIEEWRKFISEHEAFLLKNPKGDVFIVGITENPTSKYDYTSNPISTKISINWSECDKIKNAAIIG